MTSETYTDEIESQTGIVPSLSILLPDDEIEAIVIPLDDDQVWGEPQPKTPDEDPDEDIEPMLAHGGSD